MTPLKVISSGDSKRGWLDQTAWSPFLKSRTHTFLPQDEAFAPKQQQPSFAKTKLQRASHGHYSNYMTFCWNSRLTFSEDGRVGELRGRALW